MDKIDAMRVSSGSYAPISFQMSYCDPTMTNDHTDVGDAEDTLETLYTLESQIKSLCETTNFLSHRLDSIQRLLDQETFELETQPIKVFPGQHTTAVKSLLMALNLTDDNLKLGDFLRALNRYLIHNDLVDLNDLQIILSPLIASAFQKPPGLKKIPYPLLLKALPKMFK